jgi:oligopeptide transport system permease protein
MARLVLQRLVAAVPTLFAIVLICFLLAHAAPGSPFTGARRLSPQVEQNLRERYGLDRPVLEQFARYVAGLARGDLGPSMKYPGKTVAGLIADGMPTSATIGACAFVAGVAAGIGLGIAAALKRGRAFDRLSTVATLAGLALPGFVTGPLLVLVFASTLGWLPSGGLGDWRNLVMPVAVLAVPLLAAVTRIVRAGMIESLRSGAVRTARAKGLPPSRVILVHALPPALLPLVSVLGPAAAGLLTGSLVVEAVFGLPGIGRAFVVSALQRDYTVVIGVVIVFAVVVMLLNLLADVLSALLDPRMRPR